MVFPTVLQLQQTKKIKKKIFYVRERLKIQIHEKQFMHFDKIS